MDITEAILSREKHIRGASNKDCPACCCQCFPCDCGGNTHLEVVDDYPEDGYIHIFKCDKCDNEYYYRYYPYRTIKFKGEESE